MSEATERELSPEQLAEYHRHITERLGIDCAKDPDPLIDMPMIATLAGLQPGTPKQWRQRTLEGKARHPFPKPIPGDGDRFARKGTWRAVSQIIPYLEQTGNWPPESGARPATRGPRQQRADAA